jgi:hypothetical protein
MSSSVPGSTATPVLRRAIVATLALALVIAAVGGVIGYLVAGTDGLWSALIGTGLAVIFAVITGITLIAALNRPIGQFFAIIMGSWLLKIVVFMALLAVVTSLEFIHPMVLFLSVVAAVVGTLAVDVVVVMTARQSYVSDVVLPGESASTDATAPRDTPDAPPIS